jgi:hypothetical protein
MCSPNQLQLHTLAKKEHSDGSLNHKSADSSVRLGNSSGNTSMAAQARAQSTPPDAAASPFFAFSLDLLGA